MKTLTTHTLQFVHTATAGKTFTLFLECLLVTAVLAATCLPFVLIIMLHE